MPFEYLKNRKRDEWVEAWLELMDGRLRDAGLDPIQARRDMQAGAVIAVKAPYKGGRPSTYRWRPE